MTFLRAKIVVCMGLLFGFALSAGAATYYVSPSGSDSNSGLSTSAPWRSLSKVSSASSSFRPGDIVRFQSGGTWYGNLKINSSGTSSAPVTYTSYGTGAKPKFIGSRVSTWTSAGTNVWRTTVSTSDVRVVFFDGQRGTKQTSLSAVNGYGKWYLDSSRNLYVYYTSNPGSKVLWPNVNEVIYSSWGSNRHYNIIENFEVCYSNLKLIYVAPSCTNWTIRNVTAHHNGMIDGRAALGFDMAGTDHLVQNCRLYEIGANGIDVEGSRTIVEYNEVSDCYHHCFDTKGSWTNGGVGRDTIFRYNYAYATKTVNRHANGIYVGYLNSSEYAVGTKIYGNVVYRIPASGILVNGSGVNDIVIENNTVYGCNTAGINVGISGRATVRNNIAYNIAGHLPFNVNTKANKTVDYNCWYVEGGGTFARVGGTGYSNHSSYRSGTGYDARGMNANPQFVDISKNNFALRSTSPCINKGIKLALAKDINGTAIPTGSAADIGAFEYTSSTTPTTPPPTEPTEPPTEPTDPPTEPNDPPTGTSSVVLNGGFESWSSGTPASWGKSESGSSRVVAATGSNARTGSYSAQLNIDGSNSGCHIYQNVSLAANTTYTLTYYDRQSGSAGHYCYVTYTNGGTRYYIGSAGQWVTSWAAWTFPNASTWTRRTITFTTPGYAGQYQILLSRNSSASSSLWFDDVTLTGGSGTTAPQTATLDIPLAAGWNQISANIVPTNTAMSAVTSGIKGSLQMVKNGRGEVYWPAYGIDQIGTWKAADGYLVQMSAPATLRITGAPVKPGDVTYTLAEGWNLISFTGTAGMSTSSAFGSLGTSLVMAVDGADKVYVPERSIDQIASLAFGRGYWVSMLESATLRYGASAARLAATTAEADPEIPYTGHNAVILIREEISPRVNGAALAEGDEIRAYAANGRMCGTVTWENRSCALTVWGDDPLTDEVEGMKPGDPIRLRVWDRDRNEECPAQVSYAADSTYKHDGVLIAEELLGQSSPTSVEADRPLTFAMAQNYPNPFNPTTTIGFELPEASMVSLSIYNSVGQLVRTLVNEAKTPGRHAVVWDGTDSAGRKATSGVYIYKITAGKFTMSRKLMLMK